jgi:DNA-binding NarL/FixJ family response regulator
MKMANPIRVMCVDDHYLVRVGIVALLKRTTDIEVVAMASTNEEALQQFQQHSPDVVLMDLQLGGTNGVDAISAIKTLAPRTHVIVITVASGDEEMFNAMKAGASAYLLKDTIADDLINVIREVVGRQEPVASNADSGVDRRATTPSLSARERQVLALIAEGQRNKEIAASLNISSDTVQVYVKSLLLKLGVHDRTAAVTAAIRRGILHL